jgi:hypothetical protein
MRFKKVKEIGEERYFKNDGEFHRFIEYQSGTTFEEMYHCYHMLVSIVKKGRISAEASKKYWESRINTANDKLIIGKFLFYIYRGNFDRTSGYYSINILSVGKAHLYTGNDVYNIFNDEIKNSKAI